MRRGSPTSCRTSTSSDRWWRTITSSLRSGERCLGLVENWMCMVVAQVTALGTELAWRVMKLWMKSAGRTLNNYQWRVVANAMDSCTLPIFSKLVFQEVCRWKSYTAPEKTLLMTNVQVRLVQVSPCPGQCLPAVPARGEQARLDAGKDLHHPPLPVGEPRPCLRDRLQERGVGARDRGLHLLGRQGGWWEG